MEPCKDTLSMYALLKECNYPLLPDYPEAEIMLQNASCFVWRRDGEIVGWLALHSGEKHVAIDIAVRPEHRVHFWKGLGGREGAYSVLRDVFASGVERITMQTPFPEQVKMGLKMGFGLPTTESECLLTGWTELEMTKEQFKEKQ